MYIVQTKMFRAQCKRCNVQCKRCKVRIKRLREATVSLAMSAAAMPWCSRTLTSRGPA